MNYSEKHFGRRGRGSAKQNERMQVLEKRISDNHDDVEALLEKGFLCIGGPFMSPEEATECLGRVIELEPDNTEARFWLAKTYYHEFCDENKTRTVLEEAVKIDPFRADCHTFLASILYYEFNQKTLAENHYKKAIELEPNWPFPRISLIRYLIKERRLDEARKEIKQAMCTVNKTIKPEIKTDYDSYYENCVTGRAGIDKEWLEEMKDEIEELEG
ncbi:hypothetical protein ACFLY6_00565 [Candidatus Dependentiae bacterium]